MPDTVRLILAILIPFLAIGVALAVALPRALRTRSWYREHPDRFPSRRSRVLRVLPFAVLMAALAVFFAATGDWAMFALGVLGVGCFAFVMYRIAMGREELPGK